MTFPKQLAHILESGQIPHALHIAGNKEEIYPFIQALLKTHKSIENHPDVHQFFPEGKTGMHPISTIRQLAQNAALAPYEADWKVFIIHEAEKMLPTSSNALLKTLEEPPGQTLIVLLSHHPEKLLTTILSRCQSVHLSSKPKKIADENVLALLAGNYLENNWSDFDNYDPETLFETILFWYRDRFLIEIGNCEKWLHFPSHLEQLKKTILLPLEEVEKAVRQAKLAFERSTKLSTCLHMCLLTLRQLT